MSNNPINLLINASRIKYDVLSDIMRGVKLKGDKVNIFIDLYSIVYRLFKDDTVTLINDVSGSEKEIVINMTVAILNTLGHYRKFVSKMGYDNRVFLVFNPSIPDFQSHKIDNYGMKYYAKFAEDNTKFSHLTKMVMKSLEFVKTISQYIEDLFYISCEGVEEFVAMKFIMDCDEAKNDSNIVISRNDLMLQLLNKRTIIIYPNRDKSFIISKKNWHESLLKDVKYRPSKDTIPTIYIPIYLTLAGVKSRKMKFSYNRGPATVMKMINEVNNISSFDNISINVFVNKFNDIMKGKYILTEEEEYDMNQMFNAINLDTCLGSLFDYQRNNILSSIYNIFDRDSLEELNAELVSGYDILELYALESNYGVSGGMYDWQKN